MRYIHTIAANTCDLHSAMENGGAVNHRISPNDLISKLKDDGDFDKLRLKIIRKLKDNVELRNSIVSTVKQSVALNRSGAENAKPRQLSDAIHQEVGGKVMDQISDGLWEIIKSGDGMKSEITETVKAVYDKLLKPKGDENGESSHHDSMLNQKEPDHNRSATDSAGEVDNMSDSEPQEPPGFSQSDLYQIDIAKEQLKEEVRLPMPHCELPMEEQQKHKLQKVHHSQDVLGPKTLDPSSPPGFSTAVEHKEPCNGSDEEDPDVPPGFG